MTTNLNNDSTLISSGKKYYEIFIFSVLMFEFIVFCPGIQQMNPWAITPYFLSYQDFGFNSRLLIGTIFKFFSEHISSFDIYCCIIIIIIGLNALVAVTLGKVLRRSRNDRLESLKVFIMLFLASPFSISFLFYGENFGRFDTYLVIITVIMMLIVRHKYLKWLIPLLCFIAVAIYQGYVMTYMPIIAIILIYEFYKNKFKLSGLILGIFTFAAVVLLPVYFQYYAPRFDFQSAGDVVKYLSHRTDFKLNSDVIFTEYFINVVTLFSYQIQIVKSFALPFSICIIFILLPLIVVFISLWLSAFKITQDKFSKFIVFLCIAAPFMSMPIFIGNDWDRWVSALVITQFSLAFYLLDSEFECVVESADKLRIYFERHKMLFVFIVLFLSTMVFSAARMLFALMQLSAKDIFYAMLEKGRESFN